MTIKKTLIALSFGIFAVPFASADTGMIWVGGEAGYDFHLMPSTTSRAEVIEELRAFRANPVAADDWRYVGGEAGWVPPTHEYVFQNGRLEHVGNMAHNSPRPSLHMSAEERRRYEALYSGS